MIREEKDMPPKKGRRAGDPSPEGPRGHNILIVDDSDSIRRMVFETLSTMSGIQSMDVAKDGLEGLSALSRKAYHLVITDVTMPRMDGFKLVAAIRQNPKLKDIMVMVLSARGDSVDKIKGLTMGANDYVTKPFEKGELLARVTVMFKMLELQSELQVKNAEMEAANLKLALLANQDGLTGMPNRRYFFERFEVEFRRSRRLGSPLCLLMMDIDRFKSFNDTHGHLAGDEALRAIAGIILDGIRTYDMAGRYGGEEMIAFLPETDCRNALLVGERLRTAVESHAIALPGRDESDTASVTISIGIACWPDIAAKTTEDLVHAADGAMYLAKNRGRNVSVVAVPSEPTEPPKPTGT
jgi:diguanylate cyclase (GGDEF)-like protein